MDPTGATKCGRVQPRTERERERNAHLGKVDSLESELP